MYPEYFRVRKSPTVHFNFAVPNRLLPIYALTTTRWYRISRSLHIFEAHELAKVATDFQFYELYLSHNALDIVC